MHQPFALRQSASEGLVRFAARCMSGRASAVTRGLDQQRPNMRCAVRPGPCRRSLASTAQVVTARHVRTGVRSVAVLLGMDWRGRSGAARADTNMVYRLDGGVRVGVLPATCKRRLHSLHTTGYTATVVDDDSDVLHVSCDVCKTQPHPDHFWRLALDGGALSPAWCELDDEPYQDVEPHYVVSVVPPEERTRGREARKG